MTITKIELGKRFLLLAFASLLLLGGCRQDKKPTPTPPADRSTLAEQIQRLEDNGTLAKLDRSAELAGPDLDGNGVRDDIDAYIAQQNMTEPQKRAMTQVAKSLQATLLVDVKNKQALNKVGNEMTNGIHCMSIRVGYVPDNKSYFIMKKLEKLTMNTRPRVLQYDKYNTARSGSTTRLPDGDTCND